MTFYIDKSRLIIKNDYTHYIYDRFLKFENYIKEVVTNEDYVYVDSESTKELLSKYGIESVVEDISAHIQPILNSYIKKQQKNKRVQELNSIKKEKRIEKQIQETIDKIDTGVFKFKFGKHKGLLSSEVPESYKEWFKENIVFKQDFY